MHLVGKAAAILAALLLTGCLYKDQLRHMTLGELKIRYLEHARAAGLDGSGSAGVGYTWAISVGRGGIPEDPRADALRRLRNVELELLRRRQMGDTNAVPPALK